MILTELEIINFRNYNLFKYYPSPSLNIITGNNGVGKTNLVESIYYTNLARGFKNKKDNQLLNDKANEFVINAKIKSSNNQTTKLSFYFNKKTGEKKILKNEKSISKIGDLNDCVNVLLFEPGFASIFKDSPQERRDYINGYISKASEIYLLSLKRYKALLKERNLILKNENVDKVLLTTLTKQLIKESKIIINFRTQYFKKINEVINKINNEISNKNKSLRIEYVPTVELNAQFETNLMNLYKNSLDKDLKENTTNVGVNKEDYVMLIEGKDISVFGSQAENRLAAISLVISSYFILKEDVEKPIVILDDVLSELDDDNKERLINLLKKLKQVFITTTTTNYKEFEFNLEEARK